MSDAQLDKVRMEKKNLQEELKSLQNSMPVDEAAQKLMEYVNGKNDPLLNANDNEWINADKRQDCCTIC